MSSNIKIPKLGSKPNLVEGARRLSSHLKFANRLEKNYSIKSDFYMKPISSRHLNEKHLATIFAVAVMKWIDDDFTFDEYCGFSPNKKLIPDLARIIGDTQSFDTKNGILIPKRFNELESRIKTIPFSAGEPFLGCDAMKTIPPFGKFLFLTNEIAENAIREGISPFDAIEKIYNIYEKILLAEPELSLNSKNVFYLWDNNSFYFKYDISQSKLIITGEHENAPIILGKSKELMLLNYYYLSEDRSKLFSTTKHNPFEIKIPTTFDQDLDRHLCTQKKEKNFLSQLPHILYGILNKYRDTITIFNTPYSRFYSTVADIGEAIQMIEKYLISLGIKVDVVENNDELKIYGKTKTDKSKLT